MVRIANENMANAIRVVTVEEGSTRASTRWSRWAAPGRTHAADIADAMGMERVIVPLHPGLTSAFGALAADVASTRSRA